MAGTVPGDERRNAYKLVHGDSIHSDMLEQARSSVSDLELYTTVDAYVEDINAAVDTLNRHGLVVETADELDCPATARYELSTLGELALAGTYAQTLRDKLSRPQYDE